MAYTKKENTLNSKKNKFNQVNPQALELFKSWQKKTLVNDS